MDARILHHRKNVYSTRRLKQFALTSRQVIKDFQYDSGAYPASPNFEQYKHCWFRDGSFIAHAMSLCGERASADRFFNWSAEIIVKRKEDILNGKHLEARFTADGNEVPGEWATLQHDGFGVWLWVLKQHESRYGNNELFETAAGLVQHYVAAHWQEPCFDWWEEREGMHAATLACVYAGLAAWGHPEAEKVRQAIDLTDERTDSSLLVCRIFDAIDRHAFTNMLGHIEDELESPDGGIYRYRDDTYYGGGQWPVLTCLLGWYYAESGQSTKAIHKATWTLKQFDHQGWLPEQAIGNLLHHGDYEPWVQKWGEPANPLLWSHAMYIIVCHPLFD